MGVIGLIMGGVHVANAAGGFGTGNGLAGAVVSIALGLASVLVGGLAFVRSRSTAPGKDSKG